MIHISNLYVTFRNEKVFDNFTMDLARGEQMAIWGNSGVGKTTLLNVLAGFVSEYQGKVVVDDLEVASSNIVQIRKKIAWLPQETSFDFATTEELFYAPFVLEENRKNQPKINVIKTIFEEFELDESLMKKRVQELSGGQKQRILLASCLLLKKPLLLLDEPTSALDGQLKKKITDYILGIQNTTVLAVTHDEYWVSKSHRNLRLMPVK